MAHTGLTSKATIKLTFHQTTVAAAETAAAVCCHNGRFCVPVSDLCPATAHNKRHNLGLRALLHCGQVGTAVMVRPVTSHPHAGSPSASAGGAPTSAACCSVATPATTSCPACSRAAKRSAVAASCWVNRSSSRANAVRICTVAASCTRAPPGEAGPESRSSCLRVVGMPVLPNPQQGGGGPRSRSRGGGSLRTSAFGRGRVRGATVAVASVSLPAQGAASRTAAPAATLRRLSNLLSRRSSCEAILIYFVNCQFICRCNTKLSYLKSYTFCEMYYIYQVHVPPHSF